MSDRTKDRLRLFSPILAGASFRDRLVGCLGALLGIALTGLVCRSVLPVWNGVPYLVAPMGASAVLLFAVPASPLAQPWPLFGGNVISTIVGVAAAHMISDPITAAGVAVAGAILAMSLCRCLHPPGGAAALTAVIGGPAVLTAGYAFPFVPVAINSAILLAAGWVFHRLSGHAYPHRTPSSVARIAAASAGSGIHRQDIDNAIGDLGETFDISREDLDLLLQRAEHHARTRHEAIGAVKPRRASSP